MFYKFALPIFHVSKLLLLPSSHGMTINECNSLAENMPLTHTVVFTFLCIALMFYLHFQISHHTKQMFYGAVYHNSLLFYPSDVHESSTVCEHFECVLACIHQPWNSAIPLLITHIFVRALNHSPLMQTDINVCSISQFNHLTIISGQLFQTSF